MEKTEVLERVAQIPAVKRKERMNQIFKSHREGKMEQNKLENW